MAFTMKQRDRHDQIEIVRERFRQFCSYDLSAADEAALRAGCYIDFSAVYEDGKSRWVVTLSATRPEKI